MTDKKQIIIDGIDVSKCQDFYISLYSTGENRFCNCEGDNTKFLSCKDNPDCYFKQLARKMQEYEELKDYTRRQENQRETYYKEFLKKDKALEEIKDLLFQVTGVDFPKDDYITPAYKEVQTYYRNLQMQILDIINKVKGERYE